MIDDAEDDEGPSSEDIARFGGDDESDEPDTAYCPDCGAEIWDQAEVCPKCFAYVGGDTLSRPPVEEWFRRRWLALVAILVVIAIVLVWVL